jgi:hypothetical protein
MLTNIHEGVKHVMDAISYAVVVGVLAEVLPVIAATLSIIWLGMQMYDWIENKRKK